MKNTMMTEDAFLSARVAEQRPVYCWLSSGIRLEGTILGFDSEAIFMRPHAAADDADVMMIFKIQVASIATAPEKERGAFARSAVSVPRCK